MHTYATNAKPSSETTQDKENTVSLCSSRKKDTEKCDSKFNYRGFITEQILAAVTVAQQSHNVLREFETYDTAAFSGFQNVKYSFSMNSLQHGHGPTSCYILLIEEG
jgi:hypothetical protein